MQDILALAIVAVAAAYLGWRGWRFVAARKKVGCGSACGGCASGDATMPGKPLVTIEMPRRAERS